MIVDEEVYLEHFGIAGMKWGVRNKSPVSAEKQAKREGKAKKFDNRASGFQTRIDRVDAKLAKYEGKRRTPTSEALRDKKEQLTRLKDRAERDASAKREGKLTSSNKQAIAVATVVGAAAAAVMVNKYKNAKVKNLQSKHETFVSAKKVMDEKMKVRFKDLTDLSKMKGGDPNSRKNALDEIDKLKSFYDARVSKMANREGVTPSMMKKMKLEAVI